jgi:hypothetical protein
MSLVDEAFKNLKTKLEITQTEQDQAARRHVKIRELVGRELDLEDDFLTGSYARATKTKKLKDVDIFCVLRADGRDAAKRSLPPLKMLQILQEVLKLDYDQVTIGRRSCTIAFGSADDEAEEIMSFDVVPAFVRAEGGYEIPDKVSNLWVATDPTVHQEKATAKNQACGGKWIPFVKMVKGWNREAGKPVKPSFLLEVMALDIVEEPFTTYRAEFRSFLATAEEQIRRVWPDPAGLGPDVNSSMNDQEKGEAATAIRKARLTAEAAIDLENRGQERAAVEEWKKLFGWRMPRP